MGFEDEEHSSNRLHSSTDSLSSVKTKALHVMKLGEVGLSKLKQGVLSLGRSSTVKPPLPAGPPPPKSVVRIDGAPFVKEAPRLAAASGSPQHDGIAGSATQPERPDGDPIFEPEPGILSPQSKRKDVSVLDGDFFGTDSDSNADTSNLSVVLDIPEQDDGPVRLSIWKGASLISSTARPGTMVSVGSLSSFQILTCIGFIWFYLSPLCSPSVGRDSGKFRRGVGSP